MGSNNPPRAFTKSLGNVSHYDLARGECMRGGGHRRKRITQSWAGTTELTPSTRRKETSRTVATTGIGGRNGQRMDNVMTKQKINYKTRSIILDDKTWELFKQERWKSKKSWNKYVFELLNNKQNIWQQNKELFGGVSERAIEEEPVLRRSIKKIDTSKASALRGKEWNNLIDLWKPINPFFEEIYKNTTERRALEDIVSKIGLEKTKASILASVAIHGEKFAPKISKPTELKRNFSKLVAFYKERSAGKLSVGKF